MPSKQLDDLEPTLIRHGYNVKTLAEQFSAKPAELRLLFRGQLEPARIQELQEQILAAGWPIQKRMRLFHNKIYSCS